MVDVQASAPTTSTLQTEFNACNLLCGVGLLTTWVVIAAGVLILLITLAVWMNGRWTEPEVAPVEGHASGKVSKFLGQRPQRSMAHGTR